MVFNPASLLALNLLSPATIIYLSPVLLTIIGWITPWTLIESASSFRAVGSKFLRGWFGLTSISLISISETFSPLISSILPFASFFTSTGSSSSNIPSKLPKPLPKPFLFSITIYPSLKLIFFKFNCNIKH